MASPSSSTTTAISATATASPVSRSTLTTRSATIRHAITYASSLPEVDSSRIGIWGTSYTGGHVLQVAAIDKRVKCVVSQVPVVSGYRNAHRAIAEDRMPELLALFAADRQARFAGKAPAMAPVASLYPEEFSAFPGKNAYDSFQGAPKWTNQVTLRSLEMFLEHDALSYADKIGPVPLLMIVEDEDTLAAVDLSLDAYTIGCPMNIAVVDVGGNLVAHARMDNARIGAPRN